MHDTVSEPKVYLQDRIPRPLWEGSGPSSSDRQQSVSPRRTVCLTVGVKEKCDLLAQFSGRGLPAYIRSGWSHELGARVIGES